jgi:hypothetical protein
MALPAYPALRVRRRRASLLKAFEEVMMRFSRLWFALPLLLACGGTTPEPGSSTTHDALKREATCDLDCPPYPTCANTKMECGPGETCVDVPNDCAPPEDGPVTCAPTVPDCEPSS